jgi:hypothetical protein
MQQNEEHWMELCRLAVVEQNPLKLDALIVEINRLLGAKKKRLNAERAPKP